MSEYSSCAGVCGTDIYVCSPREGDSVKIDEGYKEVIEKDLRSHGFSPGIFVLTIAVSGKHGGMKYEFIPFSDEEEALKSLGMQYRMSNLSAQCTGLILPIGDDDLSDYMASRWLVEVDATGNISFENYLLSEGSDVAVADPHLRGLLALT